MWHAQGSDARLLVIDDQEANVALLTSLLEHEGYAQVLGLTDSRRALAAFAEFRPDLVLLDLRMPYLDGFEVLEQLRRVIAAGDFLPILVLTADVTPEAKRKALASGAKDFLTKPLDAAEVILRVRNLLETRQLYLELQSQNQRLDEKVRERTAQLAESEARNRAMLNAVPDLMFLHDRAGVYLDYHAADPETFPVPPDQFLGRGVREVLPPPLGAQVAELIDQVLQTGQIRSLEYPAELRGAERHFEARLVPCGEDKVMMMVRDITQRRQADERIRQLFVEAQRRLEQLSALRAIDTAIMANPDLMATLDTVVSHTMQRLSVDAADVLLLNPLTHLLGYVAGDGFHDPALGPMRLEEGEGCAGRAVLERRLVRTRNPRVDDAVRAAMYDREAFISYCGVPLIAKGQVVGVLEVFHRTAFEPDEEWLGFLETLAGQTAIAIDNARLFADLEHSNAELTLAYDTTIEGWSRALDLRDRETEGHSRRVTAMTLRLARALGMENGELVNIRRGALLHDIGKMGIPDSILLKPSTLTEAEWEIMRKHPVYAHELLQPITYLRPALDIPYCHHERWDGTGYPRGLRGDQIPLPARVFAVADVWDALSSDRPYRLAWPRAKVIEHIRSLAGKYFDPQVVAAFLRLVDE